MIIIYHCNLCTEKERNKVENLYFFPLFILGYRLINIKWQFKEMIYMAKKIEGLISNFKEKNKFD